MECIVRVDDKALRARRPGMPTGRTVRDAAELGALTRGHVEYALATARAS
jgi:hypothetical protein